MQLTQRKPVRTRSGVTPLTVVVQPLSCKWRCTYCPTFEGAPKSYTPLSPAIMRAAPLNYDPYKQLTDRLQQLKSMHHPTDKIELIVIGGTFLDPGSCTLDYQYAFMKSCYDALNETVAKDLTEAKTINETTKNRCVALCIETRPDVCEENHIDRMLDFGTTRCELGVQAIDNELYKITRRGHNVQAVQTATERLKNAAFKVGYHIMPGLPGSSVDKDIAMYKELFDNQAYQPDHIKVYPTQVMEGTILAEETKKTGWQTYNDEELLTVLKALKQLTPRYCRIMRIMRAVPSKYVHSGTTHSDFRKLAAASLIKEKKYCQCIRCREVGFAQHLGKKIDGSVQLKITPYEASNGQEWFYEYVNEADVLFALARFRLSNNHYRKELTPKTLLVRELHVYGQQVPLTEREDQASQHKGLGKQLMQEAEKRAIKEGCDQIAVISGIGVREYYRKLGYTLIGDYMMKTL
ncbi:MAG: tRNA uridine(34) 5-carboxymethylaminomethyl modification radical SAM/GNAT enzyme Elp3 [Nanoarchaeota archaeon]|nr:tRNA uridine(34) 5-carboxymethylaminomethyl modification radical SAM/GNAT enzyme Elp3 [Nanoarchaeota archaeon]